MKFRSEQKHVIDFIFPIAVFFVFAASSLAVLILAANIYRSQTEEAGENYVARTSLSYVNEKIRQNDFDGGISIRTKEGQDCLALSSVNDGVTYTTYIYEYEGMLMELFVRDDVEVTLRDGKNIMEVQDFFMEETSDGLFRFTAVDFKGNETTLIASERSTQ
ncbi:MAG: DUF4860 domain-containing protein [Coprococcus sp.]|nr:DUF4860 domain-containing protein [Coprococcus sp.]